MKDDAKLVASRAKRSTVLIVLAGSPTASPIDLAVVRASRRRSRAAPNSMPTPLGSGFGSKVTSSSSGRPWGESSSSTEWRSMPVMPSHRLWWVFERIANRSRPRPVISHISHIGRVRHSGWERMRPLSWCSASSDGSKSATC
jgi:hypothetical protein